MKRGVARPVWLIIDTLLAVVVILIAIKIFGGFFMTISPPEGDVQQLEDLVAELRAFEEDMEDAPTGEEQTITIPLRISEEWRIIGEEVQTNSGDYSQVCLENVAEGKTTQCEAFDQIIFTEDFMISHNSGEIQNVRLDARAAEDGIAVGVTT